MKRRDMLKSGIASLLALPLLAGKKAEAEEEAKDIQEERTRQYLDNLPTWDELWAFSEDGQYREYLFTAGRDRKEFLDFCEEVDGYAYVYSPRHLIQKGHFYDIIDVKIGDKNVAGISEMFHRAPRGPFKKIPDCMNMKQ